MRHQDRFQQAISELDRANSEDPHRVAVNGAMRPKELVQAERLSDWILRLEPQASEALRLAAHCQHLRRWEIPRDSYPEGRLGYLEWRKALSKFHADRAAEILTSVGYGSDIVERVRAINQKKALKLDPDVQTMEDALCLVFLAYEADDFAAKHPADKVVDIIRKTWRKMSERGRKEALALPMSEGLMGIVKRAIAEE